MADFFKRRRLLKQFLKPVIFFLVFLVFSAATAMAYLEAGSKAPDFEVTDLQGKKVSLSDYKGRVIVLKIGTTWCPDCISQTEDLIANGQFLKERDVVVVDVFVQETQNTVSSYLKGKEFKMSFVPLLDNGQVHRAYQVYLIPRLVIIDSAFRIVHDGLRMSGEDLQKKIAPLTLAVEPDGLQKEQGCEKPGPK